MAKSHRAFKSQLKMSARHSNQTLIPNSWLLHASARSHLLQILSLISSLVLTPLDLSLNKRGSVIDKTKSLMMELSSKRKTEPVKLCSTSQSRRTSALIKNNYRRRSVHLIKFAKTSNSKKYLQRLPIMTRMKSFAESSPCERRAF